MITLLFDINWSDKLVFSQRLQKNKQFIIIAPEGVVQTSLLPNLPYLTLKLCQNAQHCAV